MSDPRTSIALRWSSPWPCARRGHATHAGARAHGRGRRPRYQSRHAVVGCVPLRHVLAPDALGPSWTSRAALRSPSCPAGLAWSCDALCAPAERPAHSTYSSRRHQLPTSVVPTRQGSQSSHCHERAGIEGPKHQLLDIRTGPEGGTAPPLGLRLRPLEALRP